MDISLASDEFALGQILHDHGDMHIEFTQFVPIGESLIPYFWVKTAHKEAFEDAVRANDQFASLTELDNGDGKILYKIEWAEELDGFLSVIADHDLLIEQVIGTSERWQFQLRGPDHENLSSFQEALQSRNITIEIHRVWRPTAPDTDPYDLTEKQRTAIELAFTEGYFAVPTQIKMSELGELLGISRQSFSRRLKRGLHTLIANTIMDGK